MPSSIEITAPVSIAAQEPQRRVSGLSGFTAGKKFTPYPYTQTFCELTESKDAHQTGCGGEEILPFMTRMHSPVRVTFTAETSPNKRKSRVSEHTKCAIFNYKPLRRRDNSLVISRFRAPEATLTTLQHLSPWVSVTKADFIDPSLDCELIDFDENPPKPDFFRRSYTDGSIDLSNHSKELAYSVVQKSPSRDSRLGSPKKSDLSLINSASSGIKKANVSSKPSSSLISGQTEKRVTISDPPIKEPLQEMSKQLASAAKSLSQSSSTETLKEIKEPESNVNYYSGYLPPELEKEIANQLNIKKDSQQNGSTDKNDIQSHGNQFQWKPLIGDRSLYMRETYPVQPKMYRSDIEQLRIEGRQRLQAANNQAPSHFSALKGHGSIVRPKYNARLDEAVRHQHRQISSAQQNGAKHVPTSMELFQRQREKTYHLQSLAREMIQK